MAAAAGVGGGLTMARLAQVRGLIGATGLQLSPDGLGVDKFEDGFDVFRFEPGFAGLGDVILE